MHGEALGQMPCSEMSKASHGRQQETDNLTPLLFKLVQPGTTDQAPLLFSIWFKWQSHLFYHEKPFNKSGRRHYKTAELLRHVPRVCRQ